MEKGNAKLERARASNKRERESGQTSVKIPRCRLDASLGFYLALVQGLIFFFPAFVLFASGVCSRGLLAYRFFVLLFYFLVRPWMLRPTVEQERSLGGGGGRCHCTPVGADTWFQAKHQSLFFCRRALRFLLACSGFLLPFFVHENYSGRGLFVYLSAIIKIFSVFYRNFIDAVACYRHLKNGEIRTAFNSCRWDLDFFFLLCTTLRVGET